MATYLREELADLAGQARSYADPEAALDRARRIRARRRAVPATAAAVLVVAVTAVWVVTAGPVADESSPVGGPTRIGLPALVEPPAGPVPELPAGLPVGAAALVYRCGGCPDYLVLPDGTHYRLEGFADRDGGRQVALSPDGRWLGVETAAGFRVRDLTGTTRWTHQDFVGMAWSPDSRWLLGFRPGSGAYAVVDTTNGELARARGGDSGRLGLSTHILDSGELLVIDDRASADDRLVLRIEDPATGETRRNLRIDTRPGLRPGERTTVPDPYVDSSQADVFVAGSGVGLVLVRPAGETDAVVPPVLGALLFSLDDGELLGRVDPAPVVHLWYPRRYDGEAVLAIQAPAGVDAALEVVAHDLRAGATRVVTRLPPRTIPVLRGTAEYLSDPSAVAD